ncbi:MAG: alpha/beta hydrolase, partial [Phormidesmis sp.]
TCPVLLVGSAGDRILPSVAEARRLSRIFPSAQMVTLPYSGHACLAERDVNLDEIMRSHHLMPAPPMTAPPTTI